MPSATEIDRPVPQQERSSRRVAEYLEIAAQLFSEVGYEAATMKAIAERAGSSIGGLYRYFPDKQAVALALYTQYTAEFDELWPSVLENARNASTSEFSRELMDRISEFMAERPAYLVLLSEPIGYKRDPRARRNIRSQFSQAFIARNPALTQDEALLTSNVVIQMMKGMIALCAECEPRRRVSVTREFKRAMTNYLADVLLSK